MMMIPEAYEGRDDLPERPQGLLRLPLLPDGAVGRPRRGRVHRRPRDRRDARPQRPAPRPLAGDQGRLGRARLGDRRDGRAGRRTSCARAACSRASSSSSTSSAGRIVDDGEVKREVADAAALRRVVPTRASSTSPTCPTPSRAVPRTEPLRAAPARVRLHAGGPARAARADRGERRGADRLDGQRPRAGRALATASRRCSPTSSSSSRRSPTRRSTRSARRS